MKKTSLLLVLMLLCAAPLMFSGCGPTYTDDEILAMLVDGSWDGVMDISYPMNDGTTYFSTGTHVQFWNNLNSTTSGHGKWCNTFADADRKTYSNCNTYSYNETYCNGFADSYRKTFGYTDRWFHAADPFRISNSYRHTQGNSIGNSYNETYCKLNAYINTYGHTEGNSKRITYAYYNRRCYCHTYNKSKRNTYFNAY